MKESELDYSQHEAESDFQRLGFKLEKTSFSETEWNQLDELFYDLLDTLDDRERIIIELRYGIFDGEERTLAEVGEVTGLTRERVRQVQTGIEQSLQGAIEVFICDQEFQGLSVEKKITIPRKKASKRKSSPPVKTSSKSRRGFASMDSERRTAIASKGGKRTAELHDMSQIGKAGGTVTARRGKTYFRNIGQKGGKASTEKQSN